MFTHLFQQLSVHLREEHNLLYSFPWDFDLNMSEKTVE